MKVWYTWVLSQILLVAESGDVAEPDHPAQHSGRDAQ